MIDVLLIAVACSDLNAAADAKRTCGVCGKVFASVGSLQLHSRVHADYKPFCCQQCP